MEQWWIGSAGCILHCCYHVQQVSPVQVRHSGWECCWWKNFGQFWIVLVCVNVEGFILSFKPCLVIYVLGNIMWTCLKKLEFMTCELSDVLQTRQHSQFKVSTLGTEAGTAWKLFGKLGQEICNMCLGQAKSARDLPLGPALLPRRHMSQDTYIKCCILNMKRTDDQKGKVGKVWFWACFWACFFSKRDRSISWCFQLDQAKFSPLAIFLFENVGLFSSYFQCLFLSIQMKF